MCQLSGLTGAEPYKTLACEELYTNLHTRRTFQELTSNFLRLLFGASKHKFYTAPLLGA